MTKRQEENAGNEYVSNAAFQLRKYCSSFFEFQASDRLSIICSPHRPQGTENIHPACRYPSGFALGVLRTRVQCSSRPSYNVAYKHPRKNAGTNFFLDGMDNIASENGTLPCQLTVQLKYN